MDMNWGVKIFLTLAVFMIGMVSVGIYMVNKNTDTLEEIDYYEKGINFDETYVRRQNLKDHGAEPTVAIKDGSVLEVNFKHQGNTGEWMMKRASDNNLDQNKHFSIEDGLLRIPIEDLAGGAWQLQLEWEADGVSFQYEKNIYLSK